MADQAQENFKALQDYIVHNQVDAIKQLLTQEGIDLLLEDEHGNTSLHIACLHGNAEIVELLLQTKKIDIHHQNKEKQTALDITCASGSEDQINPKIIQLLLENHAHAVNIRLKGFNSTLLHWAARKKHFDIVKLLLTSNEIDADYIKQEDEAGCTAFLYAGQHVHSHPELILLFLESDKFTITDSEDIVNGIFESACQYGHLDVVKKLLSYPGIDIHRLDDEGRWAALGAAQDRKFLEDRTDSLAVWGNPNDRPFPEIERLLQEKLQEKLKSETKPQHVPPQFSAENTFNTKLCDDIWGNLKSIYKNQQASGLKGVYWNYQRTVKKTLVYSGVGLLLLFPLLIVRSIQAKSLKTGWHLMLGPERIEKITLSDKQSFLDYQQWRRDVERTLPSHDMRLLDYKKIQNNLYRKKKGYIKKEKLKSDPFDYKEQDDRDIYLPPHKAGLVYLYTQKPNAADVKSAEFHSAKGHSSQFVKHRLKSS